ncbi:DUF523 domain-containing protein [Vallitalea okinawensis]|uniref:DUF523 domain-containing protein n=1 Tax=Vallitalea okinawensis TaxID=2078660 RepID=UPI000CFDFB28|nr:DUF523 domain-containing protein [Vallitalea okinawensis]
MIIVSACLAGVCCRYDGKATEIPAIKKLVDDSQAVIVCPEELGGLSTPRLKSERIMAADGEFKVVNEEGEDVTSYFIEGAEKVLEIAQEIEAEFILLKSKSPSCGSHRIYDGTFTGRLIDGQGVCAQILREAGYKVMNEKEFEVGGDTNENHPHF